MRDDTGNKLTDTGLQYNKAIVEPEPEPVEVYKPDVEPQYTQPDYGVSQTVPQPAPYVLQPWQQEILSKANIVNQKIDVPETQSGSTMRLDVGDGVYQINTDLLVNKVAAEDFREIVQAVQAGQPLTPEQENVLVQTNVLTPVKQIDLSMPDINIKTKAVVEPESVVDQVVIASTKPVIKTTKIKKIGLFDTITNYIYSFIFAKQNKK